MTHVWVYVDLLLAELRLAALRDHVFDYALKRLLLTVFANHLIHGLLDCVSLQVRISFSLQVFLLFHLSNFAIGRLLCDLSCGSLLLSYGERSIVVRLKARLVVDCLTELRHHIHSPLRFSVGSLLQLDLLMTWKLYLHNFVVNELLLHQGGVLASNHGSLSLMATSASS